jgi:predicted metal-dependent RNase
MASPFRIIPLGGCGEIGKNMTIFEYGQDMLLIDCGIMFPENDMLGSISSSPTGSTCATSAIGFAASS